MFNNKNKCAIDIKGDRKICSKTEHIKLLKNYLHSTGLTCECLATLNDEDIITLLKKKFKLKNEFEIYQLSEIEKVINNSDGILKAIFVNDGPNDSTKLISNIDIDNLCKKWMDNSDQFGKKYYHVPFQMIDFMDFKNPLRDLDIHKLIKDGYDCFSCIINTDISTGRGKHWFCIYGDLDKNKNIITIEHFNSSGMPIRIPVLKWLENQCTKLKMKKYNAKYKYVNSNHQLQYSDTECGVWSLIYILSRLLGKNNKWMIKNNIKDSQITKYRDYIFR